MAGQAGKKENKKKQSNRSVFQAAILIVTAIYIMINAYSVFFKDYTFTKCDIIGFIFLTTVNFALYRLIDTLIGTWFYLPLIDLLIINLAVELLINFHWKFWFLYLVVPGYFLVKGSGYLYEYVKTIGKEGEGESDQNANAAGNPRNPQGKSNSQNQKRQVVKIKQ